MIEFVDFKRRFKENEEEINEAIGRVFERGWFILGPELEAFEKEFAKFLGSKYAVGVNSGTDAIFLALKALGVKEGDEVITVSHTATPTISAIRLAGATPVFVDVDREDMTINPVLIGKAITKKTKAILPVHIFGCPAAMEEILAIAKKHNLKTVEDACQAHGAKYKNKMAGTIGNIGCFSFYPTKNLGAFGDGGAIATDDEGLALKIKALRNYGEASKYNNESEGVNSRLDEIQAACLRWGLKKINKWNQKRKKIAEIYFEKLRGLDLILPFAGDKSRMPSWHLFVVRTKKRKELAEFLRKSGIQTLIHYPRSVFAQPAYRFLNFSEADLPVSTKVAKEVLSLPLYPELKEEEVLKICGAIKSFYENQ
ncbi:MAG: DegT/DnrJ/EryC1/StrS family aminotransferase [Candidatus Portnoybacteria bacterium]|nr:DegT/DnrJ/EryC1/StrS family aminotransferase [Candidatus Portnoybacteria bacterium]